MKKLQNLMFACLLTLGLAACADDDKSSNAAPIINTDEEVTASFEAKLNESAENTIIFTNPHLTDADLDVSIYNYEPSITIISSTCDNMTGNTIGSSYITSRLAAGESCEMKYTYTPAQFATKALELNIDYSKVYEAVCPAPNFVPSIEQAMTRNKYVNMTIYNYAVDSNGTKSPDIINVEINPEWAVSGYTTDYTNTNTDATFNLTAKKGTYNYYLFNNMELISNDSNCSVSANKLTVNDNNSVCSLTLKNSVSTTIQFIPTIDTTNPYYNVNVNVNSNYTYSILPSQFYSSTFYPEYNINNLTGNTYFHVALLTNNEKITSYEITGTNKDKFKVASTKHNGCTVTNTEISIPAEQENCFFTVEIADIKESGDFTATLNTTSSTNGSQTYNIQGEVSLLTLNDMLLTYCQQNTQSKKLFN